jgi:uncharacterized protein (TIGR02145 family)
LNGFVKSHTQYPIVIFEYGTTTSYGQIINAINNNMLSYSLFSATLTGLTPSTTYHYRIKASPEYGNDVTLTTSDTESRGIIFNPNLTYGLVSDNSGNTYKTIQVGTQTWMAENLKTVNYNDGTAIPLVTNGATWVTLSTPGYCWYNNDRVTFRAIYGALYNWNAVNTGKLCPIGWHVPTDIEWSTLTTYLGGESLAGVKLKETGTNHWQVNTGASNESGFTALPGGSHNLYGTFFYSIGYQGEWWSSSEYTSASAYHRRMHCSTKEVSRSYVGKVFGYSVRCIKD